MGKVGSLFTFYEKAKQEAKREATPKKTPRRRGLQGIICNFVTPKCVSDRPKRL